MKNGKLIKNWQAERRISSLGRLGENKYYDMDQVIDAALNKAREQTLKR